MKLTKINPAYLPETILRDCTEPVYVQFRASEIGIRADTPLLKIADKVCVSDAIVAKDPMFGYKWACIAMNGKLAWSRPYKTIRAAIKNAEDC